MMSALRSVMTVLAVLVILQTNLRAGDPPDAVKKWFELSVGRWESTAHLNPPLVTIGENTLMAGGHVLLERTDSYVCLHAWEADISKLVSTIYNSSGMHIRREQDVKGGTISGSASGVDGEGVAFKGHFTQTISEDGTTSEAKYIGTHKGEETTIRWTGKKLPDK